MPVYEFYCSDCHAIYNFLSRRVNTDRKPACPRCAKPELTRQVSRFAVSKGRKEEPDGGMPGMPDIDEAKLEKAMMSLAGEMEGMDENDPRQMAHLMRRLSSVAGINLGGGIEEAISRLESGEDPEKIEQEMGDLLDGDALFSTEGIKGLKRKYAPPSHDDTLYVLE